MGAFRVVSILFALAAAPSCHGKGRDTMTKRSCDPVALGHELNVPLPPSTRVVGVERENGMDDLVSAKLEMAESEWPVFLASTPIQPDAFRPGPRGMLGEDHGFWDPHQAAGLKTAQAPLPGARWLNIGVSSAVNGTVVVYIVNHGT